MRCVPATLNLRFGLSDHSYSILHEGIVLTQGESPMHSASQPRPWRLALQELLVCAFALTQPCRAADAVVVGSKRFTESYVLGEIVRQTYAARGIDAVHKQGLGNTGILERALAGGSIDIYPEYTGTIVRELLKRDGNPSLAELNTWLAPRGLKAALPLELRQLPWL